MNREDVLHRLIDAVAGRQNVSPDEVDELHAAVSPPAPEPEPEAEEPAEEAAPEPAPEPEAQPEPAPVFGTEQAPQAGV